MYTITVTSLADSGTGTLRQAIADANAYNGTDEVEIVFDSSLSGTISLSSALNIPTGVLVNLPEGVTINLNGKTMNVYGTLNAEWDTAADAIINAAATSSYLYIQKGGKVSLTNANINLSNTSRSKFYVYDGGVLEMTGGSLYAGSYITVNGGGTMSLNGTQVKQFVINSGTLTLTDVSVTYISNSGEGKLTMEGGSVVHHVDNSGEMTLTDVSVEGYVRNNGAGRLTMEGGGVNQYVGNDGEMTLSNLSVDQGASNDGREMTLTNVRVGGNVTNGGRLISGGGESAVLTMYGGSVEGSVSNYREMMLTDVDTTGSVLNDDEGMLQMEGGSVGREVRNSAEMTLTDVNVDGLVRNDGEMTLTDVVCESLLLHSSDRVKIKGEHGVTLTGEKTFYITSHSTNFFKGDVREWLDSFQWSTTSENAYIQLENLDLGKVTLSALPDGLPGGSGEV